MKFRVSLCLLLLFLIRKIALVVSTLVILMNLDRFLEAASTFV